MILFEVFNNAKALSPQTFAIYCEFTPNEGELVNSEEEKKKNRRPFFLSSCSRLRKFEYECERKLESGRERESEKEKHSFFRLKSTEKNYRENWEDAMMIFAAIKYVARSVLWMGCWFFTVRKSLREFHHNERRAHSGDCRCVMSLERLHASSR